MKSRLKQFMQTRLVAKMAALKNSPFNSTLITMQNFKQILTLLPFLLILYSCVGTVQEAGTDGSLIFEKPTIRFDYLGITQSRPIAHDKIEIEFYPAGGDGFEYVLTINDSTTPIRLDPNALLPISGGRFLYTIKNLNFNSEYKLKLIAKNISKNSLSRNENVAFVKTFDNQVAQFDGITQVSLVPGNTSTQILVNWLVAPWEGTISGSNYDPVRWEIIYISSLGGISNINNDSYSGTDRVRITVPSENNCFSSNLSGCSSASPFSFQTAAIISNLIPDTRYYIQVRAINKLYEKQKRDNILEEKPITVSREVNTRFLTIRTDPLKNESDFDPESVVLVNTPGAASQNSINIYWKEGTGNFDHYRIFVKKVVEGDPSKDEMTDIVLNQLNTPGGYSTPQDGLKNTFFIKENLEKLSWYQVKVALCKTSECNLDASLPNPAIVSNVKAIQVKPILAPFSGITSIAPPGQYSQRDTVDLKFTPPLLTAGHATGLEFYCVDPANQNSMIRMSASPITSNEIPRCMGLFLPEPEPASLLNFQSFKVQGVNTSTSTEYCFAATPVISGPPDYRLPVPDRIIRCIHPEVIPPTVSQFPGISGACNIDGNSVTVNWIKPKGGVYSGFKVFWKEKLATEKFSFANAITGSSYSTHPVDLNAGATQFTIDNLMPGKSYQVGVLAVVDMSPNPNLYSEFNLNVKDCNIQLPIAEFKGFTRILALGPKMDGRIINDATKKLPESARMFEAVNSDGIPYEVPMASLTEADKSGTFFTNAPGDNSSTSFQSLADAAIGENGSNMSKDGIVSLSWEEVGLDYPGATTFFTTGQNHDPNRDKRIWGYRVYRSSDNKLTWKEVTQKNVSGLIHARDLTYFPRPNKAAVTKRMAFFTDYSVYSLEEYFNEDKQLEVERARNYFYKIVPVFNNLELTYSSPTHHIVKITLPPPNMALVHRWMANRGRCLEMGKIPNIGNNYSCPYNGVGAVSPSIPEITGNTILDQRGDLLVDRQELGCRYTRGDQTATPNVGLSAFEDIMNLDKVSKFKGHPVLSGGVENLSARFSGCLGTQNITFGNTPSDFAPDYTSVLQGDCIGSHKQRLALKVCPSFTGFYEAAVVKSPGVPYNTEAPDCTTNTSENDEYPNNIAAAYSFNNRGKYVMQSEPLAVFYNRTSSAGQNLAIHGPGLNTEDPAVIKNRSWLNMGVSNNCSINLAAIDGSGYMHPRWLSIAELSRHEILFKGQYPDLLNKTVDEITEVSRNNNTPADLTLYNGIEGNISDTSALFKKPSLVSNRYRPTTKISRIMSSNAAKLPPLEGLPPEAAARLCDSYNVQIGIAADKNNFFSETAIKKKRLLRRSESTTASAWPENYDHNKINALEQTIASPNEIGSCINTTKTINPQQDTLKGNRYENSFPFDIGRTPLLTGSSSHNVLGTRAQPYHSASCVSRYGIQDIVGNVRESNSELIYCDYSKDRIQLGPVNGNWSPTKPGVDGTALNNDDVHPFFNTEAENDFFIVESATLKNGTPVAFTAFDSNNQVIPNFKPSVHISTESGYCSIVDNNPIRREEDSETIFRDGNIWNSILNPGGSVNTNLIQSQQADFGSIKALRNGDGRFLDFGPKGLAAALNNNNSIGVANTSNKFFNPVIGMPLACQLGSCEPISMENSEAVSDNSRISTTALFGNISPDDLEEGDAGSAPTFTVEIKDFFVGRSSFISMGITEFDYTPPTKVTVGMPGSGITGNPLTEVRLNTAGNMLSPPVLYSYPADFAPGSEVEYSRVHWQTPRETNFRMISGGSFKEAQTGRFSLDIQRSKVGTSGTGWVFSGDSMGARCAILINEEE